MTSNTLALSTLTVSSINNGTPGVAAYSTLNVSSLNVMSTTTTSSLITTGNVGIGTATPGSNFIVYNSATSQFSVINGEIDLMGSDLSGYSICTSIISNNGGTSTYGTSTYGRLGRLSVNYNTSQGGTGQASYWRDWGIDNNGSLFFTQNQSAVQAFTISGPGYVGIGSSSPTSNLQVSGSTSVYGMLRVVNSTSTTSNEVSIGYFNNPSASYSGATGSAWCHGIASFGTGTNNFGFGCVNTGLVMSMLSSGNVGIGISNPSSKLHVVGSSSISTPSVVSFVNNGGGQNLSGSDTVYSQITLGAYGPYIRCMQPNSAYTDGIRLDLCTNLGSNNTTPAPRISMLSGPSGGYVGIGTTTPGYALHVQGAIYATGEITCFSDERYKQNIVRLDRSLDIIRSLGGYYYTREDYRPGERQLGLLAQELYKVLPEAVSYDSANDKYSVNYNCMIAPLVEAVKELYDRMEAQSKIIDSQQLLIQQLLNRT